MLLTAVGVFLGLRADQWREDRSHVELAHTTLSNLRREITANRAEVVRRLPYYEKVAAGLHPLLGRREPLTLGQLVQRSEFDGTKPTEFATTAWDLALTTQALAYLDPSLAFEVSAIYKRQQGLERFADQYLQSLLTTNTLAAPDVSPVLLGMDNYFRESIREDTRLLAQYDSLLPRLTSVASR